MGSNGPQCIYHWKSVPENDKRCFKSFQFGKATCQHLFQTIFESQGLFPAIAIINVMTIEYLSWKCHGYTLHCPSKFNTVLWHIHDIESHRIWWYRISWLWKAIFSCHVHMTWWLPISSVCYWSNIYHATFGLT